MKMIRKLLHGISYTFTILRRKIWKSIAVVFAVAAFAILICVMGSAIQKQEILLEEMYEQFKVNIVIMDKYAARNEDLEMNSIYATLFMNEDSVLYEYIDDVKIRSKGDEKAVIFNQDDIQIGSLNVVGLTYIPDEVEFGVAITIAEGYDQNILTGDRSVCIVPSSICGIGGYVFIKTDDDQEAMKYEVVGTYEQDKEIIFCPYLNYNENLSGTNNNIYRLESSIKDAEQVNIIENILLGYFIEPSITGVTPIGLNEVSLFYEHSFVIPKGNLDEAIDPVKADIRKLKIVEPFIFAFSVAIGFVISMLSIKNRKAEFAVMRSLGASGIYVFFESFFEQAILCIIGTSTGTLISYFAYNGLSISQVNKILIFIACYLSGAMIEAVNIAGIKVMKIMKANE